MKHFLFKKHRARVIVLAFSYIVYSLFLFFGKRFDFITGLLSLGIFNIVWLTIIFLVVSKTYIKSESEASELLVFLTNPLIFTNFCLAIPPLS
ncbi:hypothetical protein AALM99_02070 [Lactococcus muris]|uniref:Uncharacterized protein n=1 Tax=Lactococcus muris TaxID=2941330 RepID=A0ABV4D823_9LACT|nr:hypothetical protein [Lactococcus garvieae]